MALERNVTFPSGVIARNAYSRITEIRVPVSGENTIVIVEVFLNKSKRDENAVPVAVESFELPSQAGDEAIGRNELKPWAYTRIKTIPEYSKAKDV